MNPLVRAQLRQVEQAIAGLGEVLAERADDIEKLQAARENLQKQVWTRSKELSVLESAVADYDALETANRRYREREADLEQRLRQVLAYTRALSEAIRQ
ncbi:MAG: hypothetical protein KF886_06450 [Candidatus Hydrogenedentes bacterium]|nr:hypothetical protein [Candidatus Hydrogenedentota bacterium]